MCQQIGDPNVRLPVPLSVPMFLPHPTSCATTTRAPSLLQHYPTSYTTSPPAPPRLLQHPTFCSTPPPAPSHLQHHPTSVYSTTPHHPFHAPAMHAGTYTHGRRCSRPTLTRTPTTPTCMRSSSAGLRSLTVPTKTRTCTASSPSPSLSGTCVGLPI
jgi:hypothetical protein